MKYGIIGCGVMGSAIAAALCKTAGARQVLLANRHREKAEMLATRLGCSVGENSDAALCDYVILAVKPQMMRDMLLPLRDVFSARKLPPILVSVAAGLTIATLREMAGFNASMVRLMPNTPAAIGMGMIPYCADGVGEEALAGLLRDLSAAGLLDEIPESLMDAASCVSGCGPAWCFQMLEALADGGVACGLPRQKALMYAAKMMEGSAALLLAEEKHPGQMKDAVCSPGGSTIQGVRVLEERGFRGAVMDAVMAAYAKNAELGKN